MTRIRTTALLGALCVAVVSCAQIAAFEQRAAPVIAQACDVFRKAEANPLVRLALVGGSIALPAAGAIVAEVRSYGARYCAEGPPVTDRTTSAAQADWLRDVARQMLTAAGAR